MVEQEPLDIFDVAGSESFEPPESLGRQGGILCPSIVGIGRNCDVAAFGQGPHPMRQAALGQVGL